MSRCAQGDLHAVNPGAAHPLEVLTLVAGTVGVWRLRVRLRNADRDALAEVVGDLEHRRRARDEVRRHRARLRSVPRDDRRDAGVLLAEAADGDTAGRVPGEPDTDAVELRVARVRRGGEVAEGRLRVVVVGTSAQVLLG